MRHRRRPIRLDPGRPVGGGTGRRQRRDDDQDRRACPCGAGGGNVGHALLIHAIELADADRYQAGGQVVDKVLAGNGRPQAVGLRDVAHHEPGSGLAQRFEPRGRLADQARHLIAPAGQRRHQMRADEPARASYQNFGHDVG